MSGHPAAITVALIVTSLALTITVIANAGCQARLSREKLPVLAAAPLGVVVIIVVVGLVVIALK